MAPFERQLSLSPSIASTTTLKTAASTPPASPSPPYFPSEVSIDSPPKLPPPPPIRLNDNKGKRNPHDSPLASASIRILGAFASLLGLPIFLYKTFPASTVTGNLLVMIDTWDAFLHFSSIYLCLLAVLVGVYFGPCCLDKCNCVCDRLGGDGGNMGCGGDQERCAKRVSRCTGMTLDRSKTFMRKFRAFLATVDGVALATGLITFIPMSCVGSFPMVIPSWGWYPFGWGSFHIYRPAHLEPALQDLCIKQPIQDIKLPRRSLLPSFLQREPTQEERQHLPLCLSEQSWDTLSAGALSSYNADDVRSVLKGIDYARTTSGGLAIAVLARDVNDALPAFRQNVEAINHFFPQLSVVIFENDSTDGSRETIKEWAQQAKGYDVDLIECAEAIDCKLGRKHRDSTGELEDGFMSKAIGDMDIYRQRVADYISDGPMYRDYSHMMVVDIDLAVSISPLGILHSLGEHPGNAIASSGRQLFAFSQGTLAPPYDMSAFRPLATKENHWVLSMHESWCALKPPGDRWRNACNPTSSFLMMELLRADRGHVDTTPFYKVESAFNGAVMYPLNEIRETQASYDAGEDGQRCEHIGFNLALASKNPMYVNRKWDFHVEPSNPGGPSGWRARNVISYITSSPIIIVPLVLMQLFAFLIMIHSGTTLGVFLVYPLMAPLLSGSKTLQRMIASHHNGNKKRQRIQNGEEELTPSFKLV